MSSAVLRRIGYAVSFEVIGVLLVSGGLSLFFGAPLSESGPFAVLGSAVAMIWSILFNTIFERWEARQTRRGRGIGRRVLHAAGLEGGLVILLAPVMAWWLDVGLMAALVADIGLTLVFLVYTYLFNLGFDLVFGLPQSARPRESAAPH